MESKMKEYAPQILDEDERVEYAAPVESMVQSVGWQYYSDILKRLRQNTRENFDTMVTVEDMRFQQGLIQGLLLAQNIPEMLFKEANETVDREEKKEKSRLNLSEGYGSPTF